MMTAQELIDLEVEEIRSTFGGLSRDYGEYIRASKAYMDVSVMISRFGPLPHGFCHAGWPWARIQFKPDRFDAQKNLIKAAAFIVLEHERLLEKSVADSAFERVERSRAG